MNARPMILMSPYFATRPEFLFLAEDNKWRAACVHLFARAYCANYELDGRFPKSALKLVHGRAFDAAALVEVGLWKDVGTAWKLIDWHETARYRPRIAVPTSVRGQVFARDGFACRTCGATESLSIDHIHPWSQGGTNKITNLQTLCRSCNSRKRDRI